MEYTIVLKDIKRFYNSGAYRIEALKGINLLIKKGEFVAIMGPSGSGKSTLLNIIGCLDRASEGQYLLDGIDVTTLSETELARIRNRKIGFVFQNFNLLPRVSAVKNVELPLLYSGVDPERRRQMALRVLQKVGLMERAEHKPSELSGGEQQRVAIARALVNNPSVILADEPTGNLDSSSGRQIMEILTRLNEEGTTVVMVTHDREVAGFARKVLILKDGMIQNETS